MRILLLGEFSAFHKNLKEGLVALGHEVVLASHGDGWKKIESDIDLNYHHKLLKDGISNRVFPILHINQLTGFDVVQIINPFLMYRKLFPAKQYLQYICKRNKKSFLVGAGEDSFVWKVARKKMRYGPFDDYLKYDIKSDTFFMESKKAYQHNLNILNMVDGIIPIMYDYEIAYEEYSNQDKIKKTIPIPMNIDKIEYKPNKIKDGKIVIFHGLNRYGFKGTKYIEEAFDYLREKYPNDLELIIDGGLPLDEYLELMGKTNVVIDQMNSYSLGVNGIYAMAMGKVVIGGAEPESLKSNYRVTTSPIINVTPNSIELIKVIENLIEKKNSIENMGIESREFVKQHHDYKKIAQEYLKIWS